MHNLSAETSSFHPSFEAHSPLAELYIRFFHFFFPQLATGFYWCEKSFGTEYRYHDIRATSATFFQERSSGKLVGVLIDVDYFTDELIRKRLVHIPKHLRNPKTRHRDNLYRDAVIEKKRKREESEES